MLSSVFWLSFLAVFVLLAWLSDAVLCLSELDIHKVRRPTPRARIVKLTVPERPFSTGWKRAA